MRICPECGKELNDNEMFCGKCGAKIEIKEEPIKETAEKRKSPKILTLIIAGLMVASAVIAGICVNTSAKSTFSEAESLADENKFERAVVKYEKLDKYPRALLVKKYDTAELIQKTYEDWAAYLADQEDYEKAIKIYKEKIGISEQNKQNIADLYYEWGIELLRNDEEEDSLIVFRKGKEEFSDLRFNVWIDRLTQNTEETYISDGNVTAAHAYFYDEYGHWVYAPFYDEDFGTFTYEDLNEIVESGAQSKKSQFYAYTYESLGSNEFKVYETSREKDPEYGPDMYYEIWTVDENNYVNHIKEYSEGELRADVNRERDDNGNIVKSVRQEYWTDRIDITEYYSEYDGYRLKSYERRFLNDGHIFQVKYTEWDKADRPIKGTIISDKEQTDRILTYNHGYMAFYSPYVFLNKK